MNAAPRLTQVSEQKHLDFHVNGSYSRYLKTFKTADFISVQGVFFIHYKAAIKIEKKICDLPPREMGWHQSSVLLLVIFSRYKKCFKDKDHF